jgi:hypothetical protein
LISAALTPFLESGISVLVGTRSPRLFPECMRAMGARVERGGEELCVFAPAATAAVTLANLRDNGRIAVCFSRPQDHRSMQVKGKLLSVTDADSTDRDHVLRYRAAFAQELFWVGLPAQTTLRIAHWPCHAIRLQAETVFVQTPGPGAGEPLTPATPQP